MRPLQSIAMGLVIVALHAEFGGFDALADPLGWVLVLLGVRDLPVDLESRRTLLGLAALAGAVSIPLWIPGVSDALYDTDPALLWAVNLPQLGFGGLLAHVLARRAADTEDTRAAPGSGSQSPGSWRSRCCRSWSGARASMRSRCRRTSAPPWCCWP